MSTEELETVATESVALDGDDITVIREPHDGGSRRRVAWIVGGVVVVLVAIAAVAYAAQDDEPEAHVRAASPPTAAESSDTAPVTTAPKASKPAPTTVPARSATPNTAAPPVRVPPSAPVAIVPPVGTTPVATTPPPGSPSDLQWTAPKSLTIKTGKSVTISVKATNPARGVVTLPIALSCAPTLDNSGMCAQVAQAIAPGQSASAQWKIDATGIAPGSYTLNYAGLLQIPVTVTA